MKKNNVLDVLNVLVKAGSEPMSAAALSAELDMLPSELLGHLERLVESEWAHLVEGEGYLLGKSAVRAWEVQAAQLLEGARALRAAQG